MKTILYFFIINLTAGLSNLFAQSDFYYYYEQDSIGLVLNTKKINIRVDSGFDLNQILSLEYFEPFTLHSDYSTNSNNPSEFGELEFVNPPTTTELKNIIESLKKFNGFKNVGYHFKVNDSISIGTSHLFYVKLNNESDYDLLQVFAEQKNTNIIRQVPYMPLWYCISVNENSQGTSIELANIFFESGQFAAVDPAFMFNFTFNYIDESKISCASDPEFDQQWGLKNTINPVYDINICDTWSITQGNGVKVAVVDTGIDQHIDLINNLNYVHFNSETNTEEIIPSLLGSEDGLSHGTHVAGIIGAERNNGINITGVAPKSKLLSVANSLQLKTISLVELTENLSSGIAWAWKEGKADVINNSWGFIADPFNPINFHSQLLEDSIWEAIEDGRDEKGVVVVFSSGNSMNSYGSESGEGVLSYPANAFPEILTVGAINIMGKRNIQSMFGNELDVMAPGENILSTIVNNQTTFYTGTSMAAPHVSGIAALMLSVNPCLTGQEVRDIIEQTAQKVGKTNLAEQPDIIYDMTKANGSWNNEWGYGLVDAYMAVDTALDYLTGAEGSTDLYIRDSIEDDGTEPNVNSPNTWTSPDIWVRINNDNGLTHENPDYNQSPNYISVRVQNRGCSPSSGTEQLEIYWTKANTGSPWPDGWDGTIKLDDYGQIPMGQHAGTVTIPILQPNDEVILTIPWDVPDPADYDSLGVAEPWHFCILARIEAPITDPMTFVEVTNSGINVRNNNNIASKNVHLIYTSDISLISGSVVVGNFSNQTNNFDLLFKAENRETGKKIFEEAEVTIILNDKLYNAWVSGGSNKTNISILPGSSSSFPKFKITGDHAQLQNLVLNSGESGVMALKFNFLTQEITSKQEYVYHVIQKENFTGEIIGGEAYIINKGPRNLFYGKNQNISANKDDFIHLSIDEINEAALYNWYDENDSLVYTGTNLTVIADVNKTYKIEIIAEADGFKDYANIDLELNPHQLYNVVPNPSNDNLTANYYLNNPNSAYISITGYYGNDMGVQRNYIIDTKSNSKSIDISTYAIGFYHVALVCDGQIVGTLNLIKQ